MRNTFSSKEEHLLNHTRVMTLAVNMDHVPWSVPVYFVHDDNNFYFFSNKTSRHIRYSEPRLSVAASIFHDSDNMNKIFGLQMRGIIESVSQIFLYMKIVRKYVEKFDFLQQTFGIDILKDKDFFRDRFKAELYVFRPASFYLSDRQARIQGSFLED